MPAASGNLGWNTSVPFSVLTLPASGGTSPRPAYTTSEPCRAETRKVFPSNWMETGCAAAITPEIRMIAATAKLRESNRLDVERTCRRSETAAASRREHDGARRVERREMTHVGHRRDLVVRRARDIDDRRSEEHTSELQSRFGISGGVFWLTRE